MLIPTLSMAVLAVVLVFIGYLKGGGAHITGLKSAWALLIQMAPMLVFAMVIAGMIQALVPREIISRWIGAESGLRGILTGTVLGSLTPSGPFVSMPIAAGLLRSGASISTMVAYMTAWSLIAFARLPIEVGILGWKFALVRLACVFFFPPIAGLIASVFFSRVNIT